MAVISKTGSLYTLTFTSLDQGCYQLQTNCYNYYYYQLPLLQLLLLLYYFQSITTWVSFTITITRFLLHKRNWGGGAEEHKNLNFM